ncbi:Zn-ribbon domain-containing protein [Halobaculum sp. CBA1158]|uniref:Zn-ribbon domain-containing protein n=1 Tax=Halobaculum sp. CBA1158 TaxID=2904243 RepID=UPI001F213F03|nr:Zn-ribbon domain-containing protein [Halobaculum sp. CBA1158]UIO99797.1 Zn-ribbon domain-containing protein [Halobaculum sp. CBA1158]
MPHQCTNCGRTFADGSKEMLSGCPDCGGNKFQFRPKGAADSGPGSDSESDLDSDRSSSETTTPSSLSNSGSPDPSLSGSSSPESTPPDPTRSPSDHESSSAVEGEDGAQADARSEIVSEDEIAEAAGSSAGNAASDRAAGDPPAGDRAAERDATPAGDRAAERDATPAGDDPAADTADTGTAAGDDSEEEYDPDLDTLRQKLNDQFESIRIVSPGTYELNLMELYDREEYIISLREDGRYVIEMPEGWDDR